LLNKDKKDYLSILNIPQPIFDKVHQLLLEGTTKSFSLVSEIFKDTLSFKTKINRVCEAEQCRSKYVKCKKALTVFLY
jgi:hypothetical protein